MLSGNWTFKYDSCTYVLCLANMFFPNLCEKKTRETVS